MKPRPAESVDNKLVRFESAGQALAEVVDKANMDSGSPSVSSGFARRLSPHLTILQVVRFDRARGSGTHVGFPGLHS